MIESFETRKKLKNDFRQKINRSSLQRCYTILTTHIKSNQKYTYSN